MTTLPQLLKTGIFTALFLGLAVGIFPVMAKVEPLTAAECGGLGIKCTGNEDSAAVKDRIFNIVNIALTLVGILAAIFIIYGGVLMIIDMGEEENVKKGKRIVIYAVLGLLVVGLAALIVNFVIKGVNQAEVPGSNIYALESSQSLS